MMMGLGQTRRWQERLGPRLKMMVLVRGVQRVEDPIDPPESDRPEAQRVDPKSIAGRIRF